MHSFKLKWLRAAGFLAACGVLTWVLNFALLQYNIARVNVHRISTQEYDDIFIGTSRGICSINPEIVDRKTGRKSTNICMSDAHLTDLYYLVKEACRKQNPKRIIYELDPSYWSTKQNNGANAVYIYKEFPMSLVKAEYFFAKIIDMDSRVTLAPWHYYRNRIVDVRETVKTKLSDAYRNYDVAPLNTPLQSYTDEGYLYQIADRQGDKGDKNFIRWNKDGTLQKAKDYFEKIVELCREQGMELVVITTPVSQETLDMYSEEYETANEYFTELMKEYGVPYYDFNYIEMEGFDKSLAGYLDYEGHMDGMQGDAFSEVLGEYLK